MTGYTLAPIGRSEAPFEGTYDGAGHVIRNLSIQAQRTDAAGLFSVMNGNIYNLGLEGGDISGGNCGAIAACSSNEEGKIVNCYTNISVQAQRAGGITDDFAGNIWNCFSAGRLNGVDAAGAVSFHNAKDVKQVFEVGDNVAAVFQTPATSDMRVTSCEPTILNSTALLQKMNDYVAEFNAGLTKSAEGEDAGECEQSNEGDANDEEAMLPLVSWKLGGDGHLVFDNGAA